MMWPPVAGKPPSLLLPTNLAGEISERRPEKIDLDSRTMVEILPFVDDENEDQFTWIPLSHQDLPRDTSTNNGCSGSKSPEVAETTAAPRSSSRSRIANSDPTNSYSTHEQLLLHSREHHSMSKRHNGTVLVEKFHTGEIKNCDDDEKWHELHSNSKKEHPTRADDASTPIIIKPWLWGDKVIAHITSPIHTKISDSATMSTSRVENADDNNILWRRPDELDIDDIGGNLNDKNPPRQRADHHLRDMDEEYDDTLKTRRHVVSLPWSGEEEKEAHDNDQRWKRPPQQQYITQRRTSNHDQTLRNDDSSSSSTIKSKLQQTLIHDPLRSWPYCFIRHFYFEMKNQIIVTWHSHRQQNDLHTILAPLSLVILITLWGIVLIATGCTGLVTIISRSLVPLIWSCYLSLIGYSWRMANQIVRISVFASFLAGLIVWVGMRFATNRKKGNKNDKRQEFQTPSVSAIIPWIIAVTSPSLVESIAIALSIQMMFASILMPPSDEQECLALDGIEHNSFCFEADMGPDQSAPSSFGMRTRTIFFTLALILALINIFIVSIIVNMLERGRDMSEQDISVAENATVKSSSSFESQNLLSEALSRNYNRIQQNIEVYHTISVCTLVFLTVILVLCRTLYIHFRTKGGTIIISLINRIGIVGINVLCIGLGVWALVYSWHFTMNKINATDGVLANKTSFGEISRKALKNSIVEISTHAVWCKEDMGSSLLGIISDDDGALRYAIFEWIVDRWTASRTPSDPSFPPAAEDCDENVGKENAKISHPHFSNDSSSANNTNTSTSSGNHQPILPSYQCLQDVISKLDADETLIPTIQRYREWVYSLPPSQNATMCVAIWKLCPAAIVLLTVALLYFVRAACVGLVAWFSWCLGTSFASSSNESGGCILFMFTICIVMSPLIFLEYHRVKLWWTCITSNMNKMKSEMESSDAETNSSLSMTLLRADPKLDSSQQLNFNILPDTSDIFLRIWFLLVESISVLESSIPVVRCATIASATADLTSNSICLVDLAIEIKKRGLLCGVGIMVWDAFTYHLSREIEQRKQETVGESQANGRQTEDREELGGKYTGAIVSSVENIGKLSRNIGGLMDQKSASRVKSTVFRETEQSSTVCAEKGEESHKVSRQCDVQNDEPLTSVEKETQQSPRFHVEEIPLQETSGDKNCGNGALPVLISGGLVIAGAVAGLAVHSAATNRGQKRRDS